MRRFGLVAFCCLLSTLAVAKTDWFVFDLGMSKSSVCSFLTANPGYQITSSRKCPEIDDYPVIDVTEVWEMRASLPDDASSAVREGARIAKNKLTLTKLTDPTITHEVHLAFKRGVLIAVWITFPSIYYQGVYQQLHDRFHRPIFEQGFPLAGVWRDKIPRDPGDKKEAANFISVFAHGVTKIYLVTYNNLEGNVMMGWVGLGSMTRDEEKLMPATE